jgi:VanZ family protein
VSQPALTALPSLRVRRALFVLVLLAVLVLALKPVPVEPPLFDHIDKLNHVGCFALLAVLAWWAGCRPLWAVGAGLLAFGVLIEVAQSAVPTRSADPLDLVADLLGIALGLLLCAAVRARRLNRLRASRTPPAGGAQTAVASDASRPR